MIRITDTTLCTELFANTSAPLFRSFYVALLELGVARVQVDARGLEKLGGALVKERTVLLVDTPPASSGWPAGFAGFLSGSCPSYEEALKLHSSPTRILAGDSLFAADYPAIMARLLRRHPETELSVENAAYSATALAAEWIQAGGRNITACLYGTGGQTPLETVLILLHTQGYDLKNYRLSLLKPLAALWEECAGQALPAHMPILGESIFHVSSGVHADGIRKDPTLYEPFDPALVGARRHILLGRQSGRGAITLKLEEYRLNPEHFAIDTLLRTVRETSYCLGRNLREEEFAALLGRREMRAI